MSDVRIYSQIIFRLLFMKLLSNFFYIIFMLLVSIALSNCIFLKSTHIEIAIITLNCNFTKLWKDRSHACHMISDHQQPRWQALRLEFGCSKLYHLVAEMQREFRFWQLFVLIESFWMHVIGSFHSFLLYVMRNILSTVIVYVEVVLNLAICFAFVYWGPLPLASGYHLW